MTLELPALLITDDDRDLRETLRGVFEPTGLRTLLAADGQEAVEIVESEPVHLLLVDMHMPRLSGLEAIRRVKQLRSPLPCILMSAALDEELLASARHADVYSVQAKPLSFSQITGVVNEALQQFYGWQGERRLP